MWKRGVLWTMTGLLAITVSLVTLEGGIRLTARPTGNRAAARFGGDRLKGLAVLARV
jgi:hypothetical protein